MSNPESPPPNSDGSQLSRELSPALTSYLKKLTQRAYELAGGQAVNSLKEKDFVDLPEKEQEELIDTLRQINQILSNEFDEKKLPWDRDKVIQWAKEQVQEKDYIEWVDNEFRFHKLPIIKTDILSLYKRHNLTELPNNLECLTLDIEGCPQIRIIPENLKVSQLILKDCPGITSISLNIGIDGWENMLKLENCSNFCQMPEKLNVQKVILHNLPQLVELSEEINCDVLSIRNCPKLNILPDNLKVKVNLTIGNCQPSVVQKAQELKRKGQIEGELVIL